MIKYSGAQTIQELLCLYVPGMSIAEGIESNIAMHGITGITQDKILFLQDGHRLNGSSTNAEAPDYRNSLDKIRQIEVPCMDKCPTDGNQGYHRPQPRTSHSWL